LAAPADGDKLVRPPRCSTLALPEGNLMLARSIMGVCLAVLYAAGAVAQEAAPPKPFLAGQVGGFVLSVPAYPGSDQRWVLPVPIVDVRVAGRLYVGAGASGLSGGAGVLLAETPGLTWSADLSLMADRPEDRADALVGLGDRGLGGFVGTTLALRRGPLQLALSGARGVEQRMGAMATAGLSGRLPAAAGGSPRSADWPCSRMRTT
jgi:outer membrane scaffolding protein for murein synthesis (MipA/OmpV family)